MDDFVAGHAAGWAEATHEIERRCVRVWHNNEYMYAVPWTELVQIRQLVGLAQKGRES